MHDLFCPIFRAYNLWSDAARLRVFLIGAGGRCRMRDGIMMFGKNSLSFSAYWNYKEQL